MYVVISKDFFNFELLTQNRGSCILQTKKYFL